jgi:hypothetical protein
MNKVYEFAVKIPELCGSEDIEGWVEGIKLLWERELSGEKDLAKRLGKSARDRAKLGFGFMAFECNVDKAFYCLDLAELCILAHRRRAHNERNDSRIDELIDIVKKEEALYPDVSEYMTAEVAVQSDGWNG